MEIKRNLKDSWKIQVELLGYTYGGDHLTHSMPLVSFYTPLKDQKISCFLIFSGVLGRGQWHETRLSIELGHSLFILGTC